VIERVFGKIRIPVAPPLKKDGASSPPQWEKLIERMKMGRGGDSP